MLHNFLNSLKRATAGLSEPPAPVPLAKWPPGLALWADSFGSQLGLTRAPPNPAQVAAICLSFGRFMPGGPGQNSGGG